MPNKIILIRILHFSSLIVVDYQYSEDPATGHLDTGFSWFPCA